MDVEAENITTEQETQHDGSDKDSTEKQTTHMQQNGNKPWMKR